MKADVTITFEQAVSGYLTRYAKIELKPSSYEDYRRRLEVLKRLPWASRPMRSVTSRDMEVWKEKRHAEGATRVFYVQEELATVLRVGIHHKETDNTPNKSDALKYTN